MSRLTSSWQTKMRMRAYKLLGYTLPTVVLAALASSLLPSKEQKVILEKPWGESVLVRGRIEIPRRSSSEVPTAWVIEGPLPKPRSGVLNIRTKTLDDAFDIKKRWNFAPHFAEDGVWSSTFYLKIPAGEIVAFRIRGEGAPDIPANARLKVISDPARPIDKYLRMIEVLIYPSLSLALLAIVMLLFARFYEV